MLTIVADRVVPSSAVGTILLSPRWKSAETMAIACLGAIFSLKPMLKEPGV